MTQTYRAQCPACGRRFRRVPLLYGAVMRVVRPGSPTLVRSVITNGGRMSVPVIALTGPLGAGKTTVLNHLLAAPGARVGVVINDFGAINVDAGLVVGQVDEAASIAGGCGAACRMPAASTKRSTLSPIRGCVSMRSSWRPAVWRNPWRSPGSSGSAARIAPASGEWSRSSTPSNTSDRSRRGSSRQRATPQPPSLS